MRKDGCQFASIHYYTVPPEKDISVIILGHRFVCISFTKNNFII